MNLTWHEVNLERVRESILPMKSGVYVIKQVKRVMGLPIQHEIIYVGKSTNLRRRFKEHCSPRYEHNIELLNASWSKKLEFWFAEMPAEKIEKVEKR